MTALRLYCRTWPQIGFALLLLAPSAAICGGLLPFELRFEALLAVSLLCLRVAVVAGWSAAELGLAAPRALGDWRGVAAATVALLAFLALEGHFVTEMRPQPDWLRFAPFYALVSSPCQEIVCRSIPKLIADQLNWSGLKYVLFSATVFSLMHLAYGDTLLLANTFVAGLAWATIYHSTRNVWPIAASHAAVGTTAFWLGVA